MRIALLSTPTNASSLQKVLEKYSEYVEFLFVFEKTVSSSEICFAPVYTFQFSRDKDYRFLLEKGIHMILVYGWNYLIPSEVLEMIPFFNIHPSLLPKYRGPIPIIFQLLNHEKEFGVTIHKMNEKFDEGPILSQKSFTLTERNYALIYMKIKSIHLNN